MKILKKIFSVIVLTGLIFSLSLVALADQAAWITKAQATKAKTLLLKQKEIIHYCKPCDDQEPTNEAIESVKVVKVESGNYWEVQVNGKGIDLAYVYFQTKTGRWKNLARELNIKVSNVPTYLPKNAS